MALRWIKFVHTQEKKNTKSNIYEERLCRAECGARRKLKELL